MKQNPCPIVSEIAEPAGIGFDELDSTIEAFRAGVADSMLAVVEQPFFVATQHLDDLLHRLQSASHGIVRPGLEEAFSGTLVAIAPELAEVLLDAPGPTRLQVELVQGTERDGFSAAAIRVTFQPRPFAACQRRVADLGQLAVLLLSDTIHCLTKVLGDVELVMHDVRLRHALSCRTHVRRPHIHGHRFHRYALSWSKRFQQTHCRHQFPLRHQVQHPRAVNVGQDGGVGMTLLRTLLVNAKVRNLFLRTAQHAALNSTDHDGIDRAPGQTGERADCLRGGTGLKQFDDERCHQGGDSAVALRPRHRQFFDPAITEFELGNACLDDGLELASVEVTPLALAPTINVSPLGRIGGVGPDLAFLQSNFDHHALVGQGKVYLLDRPRSLQSEKLLIQGGIFHVQAENIDSPDCPAARKKSQ